MFAVILVIILAIFVFGCMQDIRQLKKENQSLKWQVKVALESVEFLKKKLDPTYEPMKEINYQIQEKIISNKHVPEVQKEKKQKENKNLESIFGKNIVGILAASLIFIGIIAFGALIFTKITDGIKILLMVLGSSALLGLGSFLSFKNKNAFTLSLTGCGAGALYTTIFVSHIYFNAINSIVAYSLVLVWAVGMLFLSQRLKSNILSYVIHIGCALSIILALGYGQIDMINQVMIYSILVSITLLAMDYKYFNNIFHITSWGMIIINMALGIWAQDIIMIEPPLDINTILPADKMINGPVVLCFILLIITTIAIYILNVKTNDKVYKQLVTNGCFVLFSTFGVIPTLYDVLKNKFGLDRNMYEFLDVVYSNTEKYIMDSIPLMIALLISIVTVSILAVIIKNKLNFKISLLSNFAYLAFVMLVDTIDASQPMFSCIAILIVATMLLYHFSKDKTYWYASICLFGIEVIPTILLASSEAYVIGFIYSFIMFGVLVLLGLQIGNAFYFPSIYLLYNNIVIMTSCGYFIQDFLEADAIFAMLIIMAINVLIYVLQAKFYKPSGTVMEKVSDIIGTITESIVIFGYSLYIIIESSSYSEINIAPYFWILSILLLIFGMCKVKNMIDTKKNLLGVWYAIKFTWLTIAPIAGMTDLMDEQFIFSVLCMFIASLCILFGFKFRIKSTRIYGLIVVLASVLKIVIIDMWGQDSIIRVVSLILGGIICFAISAGYNYFEKNRLNKEN